MHSMYQTIIEKLVESKRDKQAKLIEQAYVGRSRINRKSWENITYIDIKEDFHITSTCKALGSKPHNCV